MLVRYFRRLSRIEQLRSSTGGHLLEGFAKELSQGSYQWVAARKHIRATGHFLHWIAHRNLSIESVEERYAQQFLDHLKWIFRFPVEALSRCPAQFSRVRDLARIFRRRQRWARDPARRREARLRVSLTPCENLLAQERDDFPSNISAFNGQVGSPGTELEFAL